MLSSDSVDASRGQFRSGIYQLEAPASGSCELVGLGAFLIAMGIFFLRAISSWFENISRDPVLAPILLGVAGAILGAMIGGLTDHYFFNLQFLHSAILFWLFVGLGMATMELSKTPA